MSSGTFAYEVVENWGLGSRGRAMGAVVPGVAADKRGRVFVGCRNPPALLVYDRDGVYLDTWGDDLLANPHLLWIDAQDHLYVADADSHTIRCFDPQGTLVQTWGTPGEPGAPDQPFPTVYGSTERSASGWPIAKTTASSASTLTGAIWTSGPMWSGPWTFLLLPTIPCS